MRSIVAYSVVALLLTSKAIGSQDTLGTNGIFALGLTTANGQALNGDSVAIGQVDINRPGKRQPAGPDNAANSNATIVPAEVYLHGIDAVPPANMNTDDHAEYVAGVMISTDTTATGVAPAARLFASASVGDINFVTQSAEASQLIATRASDLVHAINMSFVVDLLPSESLNGNSLLTQFVDWSARQHDVLYVVSGLEGIPDPAFGPPIDNFNGITVAASTKTIDGVYSKVADLNDFSPIVSDTRVATDIVAPGLGVNVTGLNDVPSIEPGTSLAAPHVTGTVALLIQYANERITSLDPRFDIDRSRRHEVMKAVLLNSADKIKDDGTLAPMGSFLGMDRTLLDKDNKHWLQSEAFTDFLSPLDDQLGAGH